MESHSFATIFVTLPWNRNSLECLYKVETKLSKFALGLQQCNITCQASNSMLNTLPSLANHNASFLLLM